MVAIMSSNQRNSTLSENHTREKKLGVVFQMDYHNKINQDVMTPKLYG